MNKRSSTVPCETPELKAHRSDVMPSIVTFWVFWVRDARVGVSFFFRFFLFQFLSLFSCTVIFECSASIFHLWWKLVQKMWNIRKLRKGHICFSKLREFPTEIGVFAGNIR